MGVIDGDFIEEAFAVGQFGRRRGERERDDHRRTATDGAADRYLAVVQTDQLGDDGEA